MAADKYPLATDASLVPLALAASHEQIKPESRKHKGVDVDTPRSGHAAQCRATACRRRS